MAGRRRTKKRTQLEWRRHTVLSLLAMDYSQNEIASMLKVSPASISKDVAYLRHESRLMLRSQLKEIVPLEFRQALANLKDLRRQARETLSIRGIDERTKVRLFLVIKDITESIVNLVLKGTDIDDIVKIMEEGDADETEEKTRGITAIEQLGWEKEQLEGDTDEEAKF